MTDSHEHPVNQMIKGATVLETETACEHYMLGKDGVTRIEAATKSGMHANIPYIRIWKGNFCVAEFCQHNIVGVYFAEPAP